MKSATLLSLSYRSIAAICLSGFVAACTPAPQSEGRSTEITASAERERIGAGFDFLVLALSWSPSFCRAEAGPGHPQCRGDKAHGFIVHGLWPQYEQGYPEFCDSELPGFVPDRLADSMADIMPSRGLVGHQWRKHGTCTGLDQEEYLAATRDAFERIRIPDDFHADTDAVQIDAAAIEDAFIDANDGLNEGAMAVSCSAGMVREVRICLSPTLAFRDCPEIDRRGCRQRALELPAAR